MRLGSIVKLLFTATALSGVGALEDPNNTGPAKHMLLAWSAERLILFLDIRNIEIPFDHDALLERVEKNAYIAPEITGFTPEKLISWTCQELVDYLSSPHVEEFSKTDLNDLPECSSDDKSTKAKKTLLDTAMKALSERVGRVTIIGDTKPLKDWSTAELRSFLRTYNISYPLPSLNDLAQLAYEYRYEPIQSSLTLENPSDIFDLLTSEQIVEWLRVHQGLNIAVAVRTHYMSRPFSAHKRIEGLRNIAKKHYDEMFAKDFMFEDQFRKEIAEVLKMEHVIEGTGSDDIRVYYKNEDFEVLFDLFGVKIPKRMLKESPRQTFIGSARSNTYLFATGKVIGEDYEEA